MSREKLSRMTCHQVTCNNIQADRAGYWLLKIYGQEWERGENGKDFSESCPPPTTTVDVCSMWEKQTAILEASTGPIKKSWINLSLFKISNRAFIKNSLGPLCPLLVNTSLVLLWLMRAASEWAQCLCAWSLTLVSRTKSWTRFTSGLPQGVFPVSKTATLSKHILTVAYLNSVAISLGLPHLKSAFIKIIMFCFDRQGCVDLTIHLLFQHLN